MSAAFHSVRDLTLMSALLRIAAAVLTGGLIGMERGWHGRAAGMRTHILVCLGSTLTALVGIYAVQVLHLNSDPLRVGAQVVSGIGFLGAGTILIKDRSHVTGLTTAAGLWATAAIGLALGIGFYEAALLSVILILPANETLPRMERRMEARSLGGHIYAELSDVARVNDFTELVRQKYGAENLRITPARSGISGNVGVEIELFPDQKKELRMICRELSQREYIPFAVDIQ
jgi:putative Mg2+ transporter-C (MgtC) family protein